MKIALIALVLLSNAALAEDRFRGSDGKFDTTKFLASRGGFLPVPLVITEPAIGFGGGLGAIFFRPDPDRAKQPSARPSPPSMFAAFAIGTENGTKGGGAAYFGVLRNDHIRYVAVAAGAELNLDFWGVSSTPSDEPLQYELGGGLIFQRLLFRLGDSPLMIGGEWSYSTQKTTFALDNRPSDTPPDIDRDDSGLGFIAEYETLDNFFTARHGMKARLVAKAFSEKLGGDSDRQIVDAEAYGYIPLGEKWTLGLRGVGTFSGGDTPFYLRPYIDLRGVPALKYAGKHIALAEVEARWNFTRRWSIVGFGGAGYAADSAARLNQSTACTTIGTGFRYLIAEGLGIHTGIDYARGPEDQAIYLIVGSAWR